MKILTLMAMLCVSSIVLSQEQKEINNSTTYVTATFGRLGEDCSGRGICGFTETTNRAEANATLIYNKDDGFTLIVDRAKISTEDEIKILGSKLTDGSKTDEPTFVMGDSITLATKANVSSKLSVENVTVPKGEFPVVVTNEDFTITFK